jgi:predicted nucleotidyltransferase
MNAATQQFAAALQLRPDVLGIILFGSWARGSNRSDSDVDLLVIVEEGFRRAVETRDNQVFEIIYTTAASAIDFWRASPDEAVEFWRIAQVLFDRDGTVDRLKAVGAEITAGGKAPLSDDQRAHLTFDIYDQMRTAQAIAPNDPSTARMLLHMKVLQLTEVFMDIRQLWTPPPKQRLAAIKELHPELYQRITHFYEEPSLTQQIDIAQDIADIVLKT